MGAAVPTPPTFGANGTAPTSLLNQLRDAINFLQAPPLAVLRQSTGVAQSIPNNTWTSVIFDINDVDSVTGHSTSSNNTRYTSQVNGWYEFSATCSLNNGGVGVHGIAFQTNGNSANRFAKQQHPSGQFSVPSTAATAFLAAGDYIEVQVYQNSGAAINVGNDDGVPRFQVRWVSM